MASRDLTSNPHDSETLERESAPPLDAGPDTVRAERRSLRATSFHYCLALASLAAALTLVPLWAPLLLASWAAMVVRPLHSKLVSRAGGRGGAAAVVTVLLVVVTLAPIVVMSLSLFGATASLIDRVQQAGGIREALQTLLTAEPALPKGQLSPDQFQLNAQQIMEFAKKNGSGALNAATTIFGAATSAAIAVFVFV
jgi:predicted PurR-regulated permease PerM